MNQKRIWEAMSDTPITDAEEIDLRTQVAQCFIDGKQERVDRYVPSYIVRKLERELAGALAALAKLQATIYY